MKITRLIEIFEQLLLIYKKGYKEKYCFQMMVNNNIDIGMCCASYYGLGDASLYSVFCKGYYKNLLKSNGYLFPEPKNYKDLKPRIDFMKSEIKSLKNLLKQGYTHV